MTELGPSDRINLRCPRCGHVRTPIVASSYLPDGQILVICDECWRRRLWATMLNPAPPPAEDAR